MRCIVLMILMCVSNARVTLEQPDQDYLSSSTLTALHNLLHCTDKQNEPRTYDYGQYHVLRNYVPADHSNIRCHESVTYATHATVDFLDSVYPVVDRWRAPMSLTIFAPGSDLAAVTKSIRYLRDCVGNNLVRRYVSFHIFYHTRHSPGKIPKPARFRPVDCNLKPPYMIINPWETYAKKFDLDYPINVARNIARDAALTHFLLSSDIEMYPSRNLVPRFLNMIASNEYPLNNSKRLRVFPLRYFEVDSKVLVPSNKSQLKEMLELNLAIPFHKKVCVHCHPTLHDEEWLDTTGTERMEVFHVIKRQFKFAHWEPFYIGTNTEPYYDERLSWEGMNDKMLQTYILCLLDYDFMIVTNAFLCHKPGVKRLKYDRKRQDIIKRQHAYITSVIIPELLHEYPQRDECGL